MQAHVHSNLETDVKVPYNKRKSYQCRLKYGGKSWETRLNKLGLQAVP